MIDLHVQKENEKMTLNQEWSVHGISKPISILNPKYPTCAGSAVNLG